MQNSNASTSRWRPDRTSLTALGIAGGVAAIAGLVWTIGWWRDRGMRTEICAVVDRFSKLPGFDIEGNSTRQNVQRPTLEEVNRIVGREPDVPVNMSGEKAVALYSWKSPRKEYRIYVKFKKNKKTNQMEMSGGKVFGNPFGG